MEWMVWLAIGIAYSVLAVTFALLVIIAWTIVREKKQKKHIEVKEEDVYE